MEKSPLKKLPSELRNEIYLLVFAQPRPITVAHWQSNDIYSSLIKTLVAPQGGARTRSSTPHLRSLMRTCKQLRAECRGSLCSSNNFRLEPPLLASLYSTSGKLLRMSEHLFRTFEILFGSEHLSVMNSIGLDSSEVFFKCDSDDSGLLVPRFPEGTHHRDGQGNAALVRIIQSSSGPQNRHESARTLLLQGGASGNSHLWND